MTEAQTPREMMMQRISRMLVYCQHVIPPETEEARAKHFALLAGALIIFEEMSLEDAAKFLRESWDELEELAFVWDIIRDIRKLDEEPKSLEE